MIVNVPSNTRNVTANAVYQWDFGHKLQITGSGLSVCQVHFSDKTCKETIVRMGSLVNANTLEVTIPDRLLENKYTINAFIYKLEDTSGETVVHITIPVIERPRPEDFIDPVPPTALTQIQELISRSNAALTDLQDKYNHEMTYAELDALIEEKINERVIDNTDLKETVENIETTVNELKTNDNKYIEMSFYKDVKLTKTTGTEFENLGSCLPEGYYEFEILVDYSPIAYTPIIFRGYNDSDPSKYDVFTSDEVAINKKVQTPKQFQLFLEHYENTTAGSLYSVTDRVFLRDTLGTRFAGTIVKTYKLERGNE